MKFIDVMKLTGLYVLTQALFITIEGLGLVINEYVKIITKVSVKEKGEKVNER